MGSTLSSGWYTCPGCFSSCKWDDEDTVEKHTSSCEAYKKEMTYRKQLWEEADKALRNSRLPSKT